MTRRTCVMGQAAAKGTRIQSTIKQTNFGRKSSYHGRSDNFSFCKGIDTALWRVNITGRDRAILYGSYRANHLLDHGVGCDDLGLLFCFPPCYRADATSQQQTLYSVIRNTVTSFLLFPYSTSFYTNQFIHESFRNILHITKI